MFDHRSRYYSIETATFTAPDGKVIAYKRRRFLPLPTDVPSAAEVLIGDTERLDLIAAQTLGDPEQYWRICDANAMLSPFERLGGRGDLRPPERSELWTVAFEGKNE